MQERYLSMATAINLKKSGNVDGAISILNNLIKNNPYFSWYYYYLGECLRKQSKFEKAAEAYNRATQLNPNSATLHYSLAEVLLQKGELDDAIDRLQKAILLKKDTTVYYQTLALACEVKSDFELALNSWQKIIAIKPYHNTARQKVYWLQTDVAKDLIKRGDKLNQEGKIQEAVNCYQQALALNPQQPASVYRTHGDRLMSLGKFTEAETIFQQIKQLYPELPQGYHGYAKVTHSFADWELALERWQEAIAKFPENVGFHTQKGNALVKLDRFDEAEEIFLGLIEKYPNQINGYSGYASLANHLGNWELALKRWEEVIFKFPENIVFQVQKGNMLINLSRFDEAEALFQELMEKYPHQPQGYDGLARVSMHAQKWELALTRWQTAIDNFPNNLAFLVGKANAYIELHKFDSAQDLADRIFCQYPNHQQQKYALQKNIVLRQYALERSVPSLSKVEDYFKSLLSESEVSPITHPCHQILLESINGFAKTITNYGGVWHHFSMVGIIGVAVKRLLDDCFLDVSPGEILVCTFKKLIAQKLGNENLDLQQAEVLCTEANFDAAIDIYLNLGDEIIEEFIPDYPEHIDRLFSQRIEHDVTAALPEKYGSLELAKEALEADLINDDFERNSIYSQLGYLLVHLGETEKGLGYLSKRVEMSVYSQDAYIQLGYALLKVGKKESAFANYKQAVKFNFALSLLSVTLIEWAISKSHQLINSDCQKLGVYQQLSNLLVEQGLSKEALEVAHKVQTKFGDGHHSKKVLISILVAQKNKQQALQYHQQVLKENPKSADKNMGVLRTCNSLEKFENQTMLKVILCDRFQIAYATIPKCATSTVITTMRWLENGQDDDSKIISMPKHQSHKTSWVKIENLAAHYFKFVVVREPMKRFLSAVSNQVFFTRYSFENSPLLTSHQYLSIAKVEANPEINRLIENLELYVEKSQWFQFHIAPQCTRMGNQTKGFDRIFQVERLGELGEKLSEITGFEINLPRLNSGGRKISLAELSEKSMKKLIDFYARDYELLKDYYSPDKIWDEYKSLKK